VSARGRLAFLIALLGFVAVAKAMQPGPFFSLSAEPEPFPRTFVASTAPTPNAYSERPDVRVLQLLSSMNGMWERAFEAAGADYKPPRIESRAQEGSACGGDSETDWAGVYCSAGNMIVIDLDDHLVRRAAVGDDGADDLLGYVLAHEVGHHVQQLRGLRTRETRAQTVRAELHAECLSGVWGRAAGRRPPPAWTYTPDADHGTAEQQRAWLERGHASGRPADCDAIWAG
jgi:predicted metalloprotease